MGLWGAAQAMAFGLGGLLGTGASDLARYVFASPGAAYASVFALEAVMFLVAARMAAGHHTLAPHQLQPDQLLPNKSLQQHVTPTRGGPVAGAARPATLETQA